MNLLKNTAIGGFQARDIDQPPERARRSPKILISHPLPLAVGVVFFLLLAIVAGSVTSTFIFAPDQVAQGAERWSSFPWPTFSAVKKILRLGVSENPDRDRINVLLLGIGGTGHDGPLLTDTIMIASVNGKTKQAGLLSIPRDLTMPFPDGRWYKINNANAFGEFNQKFADGAEYTASIIEQNFGLPINHYLRVDFSGFETFIDSIGGVDINVERSFTDPFYPAGENLYQTMSFEVGEQHFDGKRALVFVRSRHGNNGEGSDFARARRQQLLLAAVREKVLSLPFLINPKNILSVFKTARKNVATNLKTTDILRLVNLAKYLKPEEINRVVLTAEAQGELEPIRGEDGAYLLRPKNGDYGQLKKIAKDLLDQKISTSEPVKIAANIIVQNGTFLPGLAGTISTVLQQEGFKVLATENAFERNVEIPIIYDFTKGSNQTALARLRQLTGGEVTEQIPGDILPAAAEPADFLLILGTKTKMPN